MAGSRLLKAIHVVGYLTTAVVLVEAAGAGYLYWTWWKRSEATRARLRESSRTHNRALGSSNMIETDAAKTFQPVRPPPTLSDDTLGFVFMPVFSRWSAASFQLSRNATEARGEEVFVEHDDATRQITLSRVQSFTVPRAAYLAAAQRIDSLTGGWPGSERGDCLDGVIVAFERVRIGRATSGFGNAGCDHHYEAVSQIMQPLLSSYGPKPPPVGPKGIVTPGSAAPISLAPPSGPAEGLFPAQIGSHAVSSQAATPGSTSGPISARTRAW